MDGFSYYNMFDTKGMEYIIIIAFLLLLIPFWIILNRNVKIQRQLRKAVDRITTLILKVPEGVFLSREHTWAHLARSGVASVGLNDLLVHITGETDIHFVKKPGDKIIKGEAMIEMLYDGKMLKVFFPISGEVVDLNSELKETPGLMHHDPFEEGWLYHIKPTNWKRETALYFLAEEANNWSTNELERFKEFLAVTLPKQEPELSEVVMQEGGELRGQLLQELPDGIWHGFQEEFLDPKEKS